MRILALIAMVSLASIGAADRELFIPTAHKIPAGSVRYEFRIDPLTQGNFEQYLGAGLGPSWEFAYRHENLDADHGVDAFDLDFNLISPITDLTPGIAFGVQDLFDRTSDGRRLYGVITFRNGFQSIGGEAPADMTLGVSFIGHRAYPQVGASIPFAQDVRFIVEHDGLRLAIGAEFEPFKGVDVRWILREGEPLLGLQVQRRF